MLERNEGVQSVSRALELLKLVSYSNRQGARLQDLVTQSQLSKPTVHRLLKQLIESGVLMQNSSRTYHLGIGAFELGIAAARSFPIRDVASPILEYVSQETGDSTFLVIRSGADSLCIDRKLGTYPVKVLTVEPGFRQPMGIGAGGLAMLSFLEDNERESALRAIQPRLDMYPGLTIEKLRRSVEETQSRGWACAADFAVPGVTGVGLPLFDTRGQPFAAVSVGAISLRMTESKILHAVSLLRTQIKRLTETLLNTGARL